MSNTSRERHTVPRDELQETDVFLGTRDIWGRSPRPFGLARIDRRQHVYAVGKTGTGKSTFLKSLIVQDIMAGDGVGLIDPHGDLALDVLDHIPPWRIDDVVYFDPADVEFPVSFNLLGRVSERERPLVASGIVSSFKHIWRSVKNLSRDIVPTLDAPDDDQHPEGVLAEFLAGSAAAESVAAAHVVLAIAERTFSQRLQDFLRSIDFEEKVVRVPLSRGVDLVNSQKAVRPNCDWPSRTIDFEVRENRPRCESIDTVLCRLLNRRPERRLGVENIELVTKCRGGEARRSNGSSRSGLGSGKVDPPIVFTSRSCESHYTPRIRMVLG